MTCPWVIHGRPCLRDRAHPGPHAIEVEWAEEWAPRPDTLDGLVPMLPRCGIDGHRFQCSCVARSQLVDWALGVAR